MLPGPAGKLQSLQAAGRLESATPEALGLSIGSGQEVRLALYMLMRLSHARAPPHTDILL